MYMYMYVYICFGISRCCASALKQITRYFAVTKNNRTQECPSVRRSAHILNDGVCIQTHLTAFPAKHARPFSQ